MVQRMKRIQAAQKGRGDEKRQICSEMKTSEYRLKHEDFNGGLRKSLTKVVHCIKGKTNRPARHHYFGYQRRPPKIASGADSKWL